MFYLAWRPLFYEKDDAKKAELKKPAMEKSEKFLTRLNEKAKENGGKHLVGKSMTWIDILVAYFLELIARNFHQDLLSPYGSVKSILDSVFNEPKIKEWIATRPDTPM